MKERAELSAEGALPQPGARKADFTACGDAGNTSGSGRHCPAYGKWHSVVSDGPGPRSGRRLPQVGCAISWPGCWPPTMETDRQETQATPHWSSCTAGRGSRSWAGSLRAAFESVQGYEGGQLLPTLWRRAQRGMRSTLVLFLTPSCCSCSSEVGSWVCIFVSSSSRTCLNAYAHLSYF